MLFKTKFAEKESNNKLFLRLKDGDSVQGVIRGEGSEFYVRWDKGTTKPVPASTPESVFRFRVNFVTSENGAMVSKIFEQGKTVYKQLQALAEEYDLSKTVISIRRTGSTKDNTVYTVLPSGKTKWTEALEKQISAVTLHELEAKTNGASKGLELENSPWPISSDVPNFDQNEEIPF